MNTKINGTIVRVQNADSTYGAFLISCLKSIVEALGGYEKGLEKIETTFKGEDISVMVLVFNSRTVSVSYKISNGFFELADRTTNDAEFAAAMIKHHLAKILS